MAKTKLSQEQQITLAQLNVLESTYAGLKSGYDFAKVGARASKANYEKLSGEVEELIAEIEEEENDANRQALRDELAEKKKRLEELENETTIKQASKLQFKKSIDQSIEEMKELPGVREAIQEIIGKRYDQEIKRLEKEEKTEVEDKENLEKIQELTDEEKTDNAQEISDNFKDMLNARNEMKKAQAELNEISTQLTIETDSAKITDLTQRKADITAARASAEAKYQTARAKFIALSKDADVEFEVKDVDHIVAVVNDGMERRKNRENDYDLEKVLKKQVAKTDKSIQSLQAQRAEYVQGKAAIDQEQRGQGTPQDRIEQAIEQKEQALQEEEKLHWWNFIKKHRRAKQLKQYEQELIEQQEREEEQQPQTDKAHRAFVKELQKSATIESIVNREMRETRDRVADAKRHFEENDR